MGAGGERYEVDGIPTDGIGGALTRRSMQARRSVDSHRRSGSLTLSPELGRRSQERLMNHYDVERPSMERYGLSDLAEDEEDDDDSGSSSRKRTSFDRVDKARLSGSGARHGKSSKLVDLEIKPVGIGPLDKKK